MNQVNISHDFSIMIEKLAKLAEISRINPLLWIGVETLDPDSDRF